MMFNKSRLASAVALSALVLAACGGGDDDDDTAAAPAPAPAPSAPVAVGDTVALTASGRLVSFNRTAPGTQVGAVAVTGLAQGETLLGIDVRPADGRLYGVGSAGGVYQLDASTGAATRVASLQAAAGDDNPYSGLSGTSFGFDFNPAADRLRLVSDSGQNLRINVATGDTITDGAINPAGPSVTASAYTNSFAGTGTTQLFNLDVAAGRLHLQDPPNAGTLNAGVPLGVTADAANGFDVDARSNTGYAALRMGGETALYTINLSATGNAATRVGAIAGGESLRGLALMATAAPTALALTSDNRLHAFDPRTPNTITATTAVTGLGAGEALLGIDVRPANGQLYGLATGGRLYTIDPATGAATLRTTLAADPADASAPYAGLTGTVTAVDFNPAADRLRVITSDGQNLRINVDTGATTTDGTINRASGAASVVAAAYTNSFAGTTSTALYNLEQNTDQLTLQSPPNDGTLTDVGALGVDVTGVAGFDIAGGGNGLALAALRSGTTGPFSLYNVALTGATAGTATLRGANAAAAQIGGAGGPANLVDIALRF